MADQKISQLDAITSITADDLLVVVDAPESAPVTKKITVANFFSSAPQIDGWTPLSVTWTRSGDFTFTVPGDYTTVFQKGLKIKITQGTNKYGYVLSSSYSNPNTTVILITNTNYTLTTDTITAGYYSRCASPLDFPAAFNWTPSFTSLTITGSPIIVGLFSLQGNMYTVSITFTANSGTYASTAGTTYSSVPFTPTIGSAGLMSDLTAPQNSGVCSWWASGGRLYLPTFSASGSNKILTISGLL